MVPRIAVTGPPGVGKSTVVHKVIELWQIHVTVGDVLTRDKRLKGKRIEFELVDMASGKQGQLADLWERGQEWDTIG